MSTPPVLAHTTGTCSEYRLECIGHAQRVLFYTALPLIALGDQLSKEDEGDVDQGTFWRLFSSVSAIGIFTAIAVLGLPYVKPWSLRFGIPAICNLVATLLFVSGSCSYIYIGPIGSSLSVLVRVPIAAVSKLFYRTPRDANELYETQNPELDLLIRTKSLRYVPLFLPASFRVVIYNFLSYHNRRQS